MLFRCAFLVIYSGQLGNAGAGDIAEALWLGARISLKTTAFLVAFPFVFATLPYSFWSRWPARRIRNGLGSAAITIMIALEVCISLLCLHHAFDIMLFNGITDDKAAIWDTVVHQYQFWPRLAGAIVLIGLFVALWLRLAKTSVWTPKRHVRRYVVLVAVLVPIFGIFCRFGGAFDSDNGVPWESAARTRYTLLNEAILDDGQALYRAYVTHKRATERALRSVSPEELRQAIQVLGGNSQAATLDEAFTRKTVGKPLAQRPHHVVVILGENYALWPLLPEYRDLGLARTGEWLKRRERIPIVSWPMAMGL